MATMYAAPIRWKTAIWEVMRPRLMNFCDEAFSVGSKALIIRFRVSAPYAEGNPEAEKRG